MLMLSFLLINRHLFQWISRSKWEKAPSTLSHSVFKFARLANKGQGVLSCCLPSKLFASALVPDQSAKVWHKKSWQVLGALDTEPGTRGGGRKSINVSSGIRWPIKCQGEDENTQGLFCRDYTAAPHRQWEKTTKNQYCFFLPPWTTERGLLFLPLRAIWAHPRYNQSPNSPGPSTSQVSVLECTKSS